MARTIAEIERELLDDKARRSELNALDSHSETAVWRLLISVVATAFWAMEKKWAALQVEIDRMTRAGKPMRTTQHTDNAIN